MSEGLADKALSQCEYDEEGHTIANRDIIFALAKRVKELEGAMTRVRMTIEPLLMGGRSDRSFRFDQDIKREALREIDEALGEK
jgi:hypothetical protein